jgi:hypothetical protein
MYINYINHVKEVVKSKNLTNFKSNQYYREVLEHVDYNYGMNYYTAIQKYTNITHNDIVDFCELNDKIGNTVKYSFGSFSASPTSLRYIYHTHLILSYFKTLSSEPIDIVEVGGGYGGLCLCINYFLKIYNVKINSYTIIDLPDALDLQYLYLNNFDLNYPISFSPSNFFGSNIENDKLFLISNFCFSELPMEYRDKYIHNLFPKVVNGFMAWNMIPVYNFGLNIKKITEEIHTSTGLNRYIYI